ncbi:phytanoyl-CoA dioxygenase family protein [Eilatimonas milleporae]|uniref:Phytanoyl-CoA dioxygenase PhyH n=1 Tax=Eilatimonas milleporae TaxID=911205 RepID=A0A3M0CRX8_9PROT|nr:phytanoyl-CoA dioxygenase family protein [Eilatimonas milleporae]RMB12344.1 phytanoyl-CoA dioxygenase PhyH [Eilatimonas milleporae]
MAHLHKIHMWPLWIAGVLGQAKSFRANPVLGSPALNMLGLHVARLLLAHGVMGLRWAMLRPLMPAGQRRAFHRDGYVALPGFLSADEVAAIRAELPDLDGTPRQMVQGDTLTQRILLDRTATRTTPRLRTLLSSRRFLGGLCYAAGKWHRPVFYVQRIRNGARTGGRDPQKTLHSDTFHPSMKAWLFLEDVDAAKGPFTYVPGSHRLTAKRLKWEYGISRRAARLKDGYSEKGSLRADAADLRALDLPPPQALTARAGTLVIANTHGFHGRGQAEDGASRLEIWAYGRHNPFLPLPGFGLMALGRLEDAVLQRYWRYKDRQAAKRGGRATWHPIEQGDMFG